MPIDIQPPIFAQDKNADTVSKDAFNLRLGPSNPLDCL